MNVRFSLLNEQDANKKPAPRRGRVVLTQVVKLVNTGDCHSPGLCSKRYKPYGFEPRPGQPKAPVIIIVNGFWLVNKKPVPRKGRVVLARVAKLVNTGLPLPRPL